MFKEVKILIKRILKICLDVVNIIDQAGRT
jgi:hypothetical protein